MLKKIKSTKLVWKNKTFSINDLLLCILFILICDFVGYISSLFQTESLRAWYPLLNKSLFTPPPFVFPAVWGLLYTIIGISTFLAFKNAMKEDKIYVLFIFFAQLCFNFLWTLFFFGMRAPILAFVELLFFILIVVSMMKLYKKLSFTSYILLYPYLFWLLFATYLNFFIILKN